MTNTGTTPQPRIPTFKGDNYKFWSIKMKTIFISYDLWELVENGYDVVALEERVTTAQRNEYKDKVKKDARALSFIQEGLDDSIFPAISLSITAKEAWNVLKEQFEGTNKVIAVKLQTLRREFENFAMENTENVQNFFDKITKNVNAIRSYGEELSDQKIVEKVLRSLPPKYDHVVAAIEESKDLSNYSLNELIGSLQAHEERVNRSSEKLLDDEKALLSKIVGSEKNKNQIYQCCSICKRTNHATEDCYYKNKKPMQCFHCKKFGHIEKYCREKTQEEHAKFCAETKDDEEEITLL